MNIGKQVAFMSFSSAHKERYRRREAKVGRRSTAIVSDFLYILSRLDDNGRVGQRYAPWITRLASHLERKQNQSKRVKDGATPVKHFDAAATIPPENKAKIGSWR
jgi:hypothetical protein